MGSRCEVSSGPSWELCARRTTLSEKAAFWRSSGRILDTFSAVISRCSGTRYEAVRFAISWLKSSPTYAAQRVELAKKYHGPYHESLYREGLKSPEGPSDAAKHEEQLDADLVTYPLGT